MLIHNFRQRDGWHSTRNARKVCGRD
jgi:hypothetical protein